MLKEKVFIAANYMCHKCKEKFEESELVIHHLSEFETCVLCKACHKRIHKSKSGRPVKEIYIPETFTITWTKFLAICERENSSASENIRKHITTYVRLHEPGNPQQRLDVIARDGKAYHAPLVCEDQRCRAEVDQLYRCLCISGRVLEVCEKCRDIYKGRRTLKRVLGVVHR